jgi:hypothetical protein
MTLVHLNGNTIAGLAVAAVMPAPEPRGLMITIDASNSGREVARTRARRARRRWDCVNEQVNGSEQKRSRRAIQDAKCQTA